MPTHVFSLAQLLDINPVWVAVTILLVLYFIIMIDRINMAVVALLGAGLMIILGVINQEQAVAGVDFNTISLLIGMMVIVNITRKSGLFEYVAIKSAKMVKANPRGVLVMLCLTTGVFSALLDNVTTVLLIAPVTLLIADSLKIKAFPFFFAEILVSNIAGTATLIGDPPNIIIGSAADLGFNQFLAHLLPISAINIVMLIGIVYFFSRKALSLSTAEAQAAVMLLNEKEAITDYRLMYKSLFVLFMVIAGFIVGHGWHIEPGTIALMGAAILMTIAYSGHDSEQQHEYVTHAFAEVEWVTIFFFIGLFIVVAGVDHTGILKELGERMVAYTAGSVEKTAIMMLWVSGLLSTVLNNIPFVATVIPLIHSSTPALGGEQAIEPIWWALAMGACFGGNGTLIGASANLTVAAIAKRAKQSIGFIQFMKYAFPITMLTLILSHFYIELRYFGHLGIFGL